ncbi:hypothetical protein ABFX02_02G174500 [Erythranthe guttata]
MEAINLLHHLNFSPPTATAKFNLQSVLETPYSKTSSYRSSNPITSLKSRHAQIIKIPENSADSDVKVQSLITSYFELGDFQSATKVFFMGSPQKTYLHWNSFLEDFTTYGGGNPREILEIFVGLHNMGVAFGSETMATVLKLSANLNDSLLGLEIHVCLIKKGFDRDMHSKCALMNFYGRCWDLETANKVFEESSDRSSSLLWNEAVLVALRNERWSEGLQRFRQMNFSSVKANNTFVLAKVLEACGKVEALDQGKQIHGYVIRNAMESNLLISNSLINMYLKNGFLELARAIFDLMENRNLSTYNSIISGYASFGYLEDAWLLMNEMGNCNLKPDIVTWNSLLSGNLHRGLYHKVLVLFQQMQIAGFEPNTRSVTTVLQAISELFCLNLGKSVHCYVVRRGLVSNLHVGTSLLDMYVKNNDLNSAKSVFDDIKESSIFAWNSMISGYSYNGDMENASILFNQMRIEGIEPDLVTYNSMVSGYSMIGRINEALATIRQIKNSGLNPNVVSWTALISGSSQNGYHRNALEFCYEMQKEGIKPNSNTTASLFRACAGLSLLQKGKEVHCISIKKDYTEDAFVCTALIDMYGKCGDLKSAYRVFQRAHTRTLASWNSMIMGFSTYGRGNDAVSLFHRMKEEKMQPDAITMTAVLSGCRNSGLVDEGWRLFDNMETEFKINPTIQHYSCMVDLLGRAGYLDEAWDFIEQMPTDPDSAIWGAVLRSCQIHDNIQLGEIAAKQLFRREPHNPANYIMLMNIYAASKRWDDVDKVKDLMDRRSVKLGHVWSWTEINKIVYVFSAMGDPRLDAEIYFELYKLMSEIKDKGYEPDTTCVHQNVDEEEKEKALLSHTEKMAIAYSLIKTKGNNPIRVIKNTRTCADCHTFAKYISLVKRRHIILKDGIRFHHFVEGKCSCNDFW